MNGKDIAQVIVSVVLWLIVIGIAIFMLTGCLTISKGSETRLGEVTVEADCDEDTVKVNLGIDEFNDQTDAGVDR